MEKQFICDCGMVFKSNSSLKRHPKTKIHELRMKHFDKKDDISCEHCNYMFKSINAYDAHVSNKRCTEPQPCKCGAMVMKGDFGKHYGEKMHKDYIKITYYGETYD